MASSSTLIQRWARTVWSAALAWTVLPTLRAMAGWAPLPSVAMALGEVCRVGTPVAPADDGPVGSAHEASCLLCVLSVPMVAAPLAIDGRPRPVEPGTVPGTTAIRSTAAAPQVRRACPQGPPARA